MISKPILLSELAQLVGASVIRGGNFTVVRPVNAKSGDSEGIALASDSNHIAIAAASGVGAILVPEKTSTLALESFGGACMSHPTPALAFSKILRFFEPKSEAVPGIHPTAIVAKNSVIHPLASIGPYSVIGQDCMVAEGAVIESHVAIGPRCYIGSQTIVHAHAVLIRDVKVGSQCVVGPGAVIGHVGFGYNPGPSGAEPIPHVGGVEVGNFTDIGALSAVDRGKTSSTKLGNGVKLDNLVQIGHNVQIGDHSLMASQVGIAGSSTVGKGVMIAGQAGVKDHVTIPDGTILGARAAVLADVKEPGTYVGMPLMTVREYVAQQTLLNRVKEIEAELKRLAGK